MARAGSPNSPKRPGTSRRPSTGDANLAALNDWKRLYAWSPPESINYLWFDAGTRFSQGDIGMFYHWTPYFYLVNNEGYLTGTPSPVVDKFETAVLPTLTAGGDQVVSLGRLVAWHAIDFGQSRSGLAIHQMGDRLRSAESHGRGQRQGLSVRRLQPPIQLR